MQHELESILNKINQGLPQRSEPQPSEQLSNPNHPLWELWQRMGEIYGHQWASQQGDEPNDTWARGLADMTPQQFTTGLQALLTRTETWPPNLIEFRQLCTGYGGDTDWEHKRIKAFPTDMLLEKQRTQEEAEFGLAQLDSLKKLFGASVAKNDLVLNPTRETL